MLCSHLRRLTKTVIRSFTTRPATSRAHVMRLTDMRAQQAKQALCLPPSGPGATNLVTGIANAHLDSVPLVAITGNVSTDLLGRDSFQEVDITGITMPITKHNYLVRMSSVLADTLASLPSAQSGRPGLSLSTFRKMFRSGRPNTNRPRTMFLRKKPRRSMRIC